MTMTIPRFGITFATADYSALLDVLVVLAVIYLVYMAITNWIPALSSPSPPRSGQAHVPTPQSPPSKPVLLWLAQSEEVERTTLEDTLHNQSSGMLALISKSASKGYFHHSFYLPLPEDIEECPVSSSAWPRADNKSKKIDGSRAEFQS